MRDSYAREKLYGALLALAGSGLPLEKRVVGAMLALVPLQASDFSDPDNRVKFTALDESFSAVQDEWRRSIEATAGAMSEDQLQASAKEVVGLIGHYLLALDRA